MLLVLVLYCFQSCPTLCDPMPGSSIHGILQARILGWVATSFSRGSSWPRNWTRGSYVSCIGRRVLYRATWEALQDPLPMGFSRQECWSGLPFCSPGDLLNPGIEPRSSALCADSFTVWATRESCSSCKGLENVLLLLPGRLIPFFFT